MRVRTHPESRDPSPQTQFFTQLLPRIHCCREWQISTWNISRFKSPYWRLYWNRRQKGILRHKGRTIDLGPDKVVLIAPETDFDGEYISRVEEESGYELIGGPICKNSYASDNAMQHLFIHFNLGPNIDSLHDQIFEQPIRRSQQSALGEICSAVSEDPQFPGIPLELRVLSLVSISVSLALESATSLPIGDSRISKVLDVIEADLSISHSNSRLAKMAMLSLSRFEKLFTELVGQSPGRYINSRRIDEACILLDHGGDTFEEIADKLGFYDRHHFSKVFKKYRRISPATYRKAGIHSVLNK